jgi:hypothetical protein
MEDKDADAVAVIGKIIMPMIRKVAPAMIAQQILSVQPMTSVITNGELQLGTAFLGGSKEGEWFTISFTKPFSFYFGKPEKKTDEYRNWCIATFGESYNHLTDQCFWFERDDRFYFRNEADRMLFVLKWTPNGQ